VAEPAFSTEANAASFDASHDDVFNRIASRYDLLCDLVQPLHPSPVEEPHGTPYPRVALAVHA
jgi:hypothetical protein